MIDERRFVAYEALLSDGERARFARLRLERLRREYLATRGLVRLGLGAHAGVEPARLEFETGRWGKPSVSAPAQARGLCFNVSNTDGMVALLVTWGRDVGVDVERVDRRTDAVDNAQDYLSAAEAESLRLVASSERRERFFVYWTLKEAYLKARGTGLAMPLDGLSFAIDGNAISASFTAPVDDDPRNWQFGSMAASPHHRTAWAIRRTGQDLPLEIVRTIP